MKKKAEKEEEEGGLEGIGGWVGGEETWLKGKGRGGGRRDEGLVGTIRRRVGGGEGNDIDSRYNKAITRKRRAAGGIKAWGMQWRRQWMRRWRTNKKRREGKKEEYITERSTTWVINRPNTNKARRTKAWGMNAREEEAAEWESEGRTRSQQRKEEGKRNILMNETKHEWPRA